MRLAKLTRLPGIPYVLPEQDLIDMLRQYSKHTDGQLPDSLDGREMMGGWAKKMAKELLLEMCTPPERKTDGEKKRKIEEVEQLIALLEEQAAG